MEKCCGTCEWWQRDRVDEPDGSCYWIENNPWPISLRDEHENIKEKYGRDCPCWKEREK